MHDCRATLIFDESKTNASTFDMLRLWVVCIDSPAHQLGRYSCVPMFHSIGHDNGKV